MGDKKERINNKMIQSKEKENTRGRVTIPQDERLLPPLLSVCLPQHTQPTELSPQGQHQCFLLENIGQIRDYLRSHGLELERFHVIRMKLSGTSQAYPVHSWQNQLMQALSPVLLSSGLGPGKLVSPRVVFKSQMAVVASVR